MRVFLLLLLLSLFVAPSTALRGERRSLQTDTDPEPKEEVKGESTPKPKSKASSKKSKKKCKKADKFVGKEGKAKSKSSPQSKDEPKRHRFLQPAKDDEEEYPYCLHAEFSPEECDNPADLPREGTLPTGLSLQLVHSADQDTSDLVENVREILATDTNERFVGCRKMLDPAPKGKSKAEPKDEPKRRRNRRLQAVRRGLQTAGDEEEEDENITYEESDSNVDVTGVNFEDLAIKTGGCEAIVLEEGMVCDLLESNVSIYWQATSEPDEEDEQQMRDLLVETLMSQALSGSFETVGDIQAVAVDGSGDGSGSSTTDQERGQPLGESPSGGDDSSNDNEKTSYIPYVAAAAGGLLVFGGAYAYGTSGEDEDEGSTGKPQGDTSDDSDEDNNGGGWFGGGWAGKEEEDQAEQKRKAEEAERQKEQEEKQRRKEEARAADQGGWFGSSWGKESEPEPEPEAENTGWFGW